jgi:hypothetical protein
MSSRDRPAPAGCRIVNVGSLLGRAAIAHVPVRLCQPVTDRAADVVHAVALAHISLDGYGCRASRVMGAGAPQLAQWCAANQVTGAAITDGLIFMAITMVLSRTVGLAARATRLPSALSASRNRLTAGA